MSCIIRVGVILYSNVKVEQSNDVTLSFGKRISLCVVSMSEFVVAVYYLRRSRESSIESAFLSQYTVKPKPTL